MRVNKIFNYLIAAVWLANGLLCKVLNLVPRHERIVARLLGNEFSRPITIIIGISEIMMAFWVLSEIKSKLNAVTQIAIIALMNTLEFVFAPDLLLWGKLNSLYAFLFILLIYVNRFYLNRESI